MALNRVSRADDLVPVRHALISVWDKTGLDTLVEGLLTACPGVTLYSTGGTFSALQALLGPRAEGRLVAVSDYTGQPELQGGLVKTLDFKIYLGLLSETYNEAHRQDLARTGAVAFDLVAVNLYPFDAATARPGADLEDARAHIDIGGPAMLRASAKNFLRVASLGEPAAYADILAELRTSGGATRLETRLRLARRTFALTAAYDAAVAAFLQGPHATIAGLYQEGRA